LPESGASQALRSPLKLPPEGVAVTVSISPGISILPNITFNADGHQHLLSASPVPSPLMLMVSPLVLMAISISCQHLVYCPL